MTGVSTMNYAKIFTTLFSLLVMSVATYAEEETDTSPISPWHCLEVKSGGNRVEYGTFREYWDVANKPVAPSGNKTQIQIAISKPLQIFPPLGPNKEVKKIYVSKEDGKLTLVNLGPKNTQICVRWYNPSTFQAEKEELLVENEYMFISGLQARAYKPEQIVAPGQVTIDFEQENVNRAYVSIQNEQGQLIENWGCSEESSTDPCVTKTFLVPTHAKVTVATTPKFISGIKVWYNHD